MKAEDKVVDISESLDRNGESDDLIRLSTGVILRGRMANISMILTVMAEFPRPKAPMWNDPTMGRSMENYEDPDYKSRIQAWRQEQAAALLTVFILYGTELVSKPESMLGHLPEKKKKGKETITADFLEDFELLGLPMKPQSNKWRYLKWVQTVACVTPEDSKEIQEVVGRLSGVSKKDVQAAEEFPGSEKESN